MSFTYAIYPTQRKVFPSFIVFFLTAVRKQIRRVEFPILLWANVN